ncbi:MAG: DUF389 domain-containing protein [Planctomycetota bacterium]
MLHIPKVSKQRARVIVREIAYASRPRGRFFVLLITSSLIASFGLIANSSAVIIGAMLVSPLMTPIFGAALGRLRGNPRMLGRALWGEALGVVLAVGAAYLVGLPQISLEATPEMLARTQPNLLDLFVAIFAGFAGAYALLDERVSPALPGVAIATAIVPPLSTCGLCLALEAYAGASGALLLFLANFVSVLMVALVTFWAGGLSRRRKRTIGRVLAHLGPTGVAFVVITVILTNSLIRITHDRSRSTVIHATLIEHLDSIAGAELEDMVYQGNPEGVQVLATVRSKRTVPPHWVTKMEQAIETRLEQPVDLVVRTVRSRDVCGVGKSWQVVRPNLNGLLLVSTAEDFVGREMLASQVLREAFEQEPGFELTRVEYGLSPEQESVVVAYVNTIRRLSQQEVIDLEQRLQARLEDPALHFFVRVNTAPLLGRDGPIRVEWNRRLEAGEARMAELPRIEEVILAEVARQSSCIPLRVHFNWSGERWRALVEVLGVGPMTPETVARLREAVAETLASPIDLSVWRHGDYVITEEGYSDYGTLVEPQMEEQSDRLRGLFQTGIIPKLSPGWNAWQ